MNIFILAAGLGARLRPVTYKYPKPSVPFLNVPLGLYQFRFLEQLQISTCVANSFHLPEKIESLYGSQPYFKNKILISKETGMVLGSAGGLKKASDLFEPDETILMMNADEVFFTPDNLFLSKAYEQHQLSNNLATLIVMKHPEAGNKFGAIWCDQNNRVKNIMVANSKPSQDLTPCHYIGVILLNKKILDLIPDNIETNIFYDVLIKELSNNSVGVYNLDCQWYETGNPADYLAATQNVLNKLDKSTLDFINRYDPSSVVRNEGGLSLVSNSILINEDKLRGYNVISKSTNPNNINSTLKIENSVLFENEILNLSYFS